MLLVVRAIHMQEALIICNSVYTWTENGYVEKRINNDLVHSHLTNVGAKGCRINSFRNIIQRVKKRMLLLRNRCCCWETDVAASRRNRCCCWATHYHYVNCWRPECIISRACSSTDENSYHSIAVMYSAWFQEYVLPITFPLDTSIVMLFAALWQHNHDLGINNIKWIYLNT